MQQYECINTFTSQKGEYYAKGATIYENEYYNLTGVDKANFKRVISSLEDYEDTSDKRHVFDDDDDDLMRRSEEDDDLLNMSTEDGIDDDFDFGGGDTGGAGANSDLD